MATVRIHSIYRLKNSVEQIKVKRDYTLLAEDVEAREEFQQVVGGYIEQLRQEEATSEHTPAQRYEKIKRC